MFKSISKENKRLILGISFAVILCLGYLAVASYMKSPENLNYPNPGHYPGEIGPGTFNVCNESEPFWMFPADKLGGLGFKIINGSGEFYNGLKVEDSIYDPDFIVYGNSQLGNDSSDKTTVKGDLNVSGRGDFHELCIQGNCTTVWPPGGGAGKREIQAKRKSTGEWEKIDDFGYIKSLYDRRILFCSPSDDCYEVKSDGVYKNGSYYEVNCVDATYPHVDDELLDGTSGVANQYCEYCQDNRLVAQLEYEFRHYFYEQEWCTGIGSGCNCTSHTSGTTETTVIYKIKCCEKLYTALRIVGL